MLPQWANTFQKALTMDSRLPEMVPTFMCS